MARVTLAFGVHFSTNCSFLCHALPNSAAIHYDLFRVNLIYDLLLAEQKRILARLKPDGVLVLAGILATQFAMVKAAYIRAGMKLVASCHEREWQSGAFIFQV